MLASAIAKMPSLTVLDASGVLEGYACARVLADALQTMTGLSTLYLGQNNIGDRGAEELVKVMRSCTRLTALVLCANTDGAADAGSEVVLRAGGAACRGRGALGAADAGSGSVLPIAHSASSC